MRTFVINPRGDKEFVTRVEQEGPHVTSPEALQTSLREHYPKAIVRPRALEGERGQIWYVYREGVWVRSG